VADETETPALLSALRGYPQRASSALARVEVLRALRRWRASLADRRRAVEVLSRIALIRIDDRILEAAAGLAPPDLRSLDAIHIATALSVRSDLAALVTYDRRLAAAARSLDLEVVAPR
jgi:predicted nucleic acid-binding protein